MNLEVKNLLKKNNINYDYNHFKLKHDKVKDKILFGNNLDNFHLCFNKKEQHELISNCNQPNVWSYHTNWGLPYYLGFEKDYYKAEKKENLQLYYEDNEWLLSENKNCYFIESKIFKLHNR